MEALLELEKMQRVLSLMSSRGLSHTDSSCGGAAADRFLAQFLLFMVQPFDSLTLENKFLLISELLRKLDASNEDCLHVVPDDNTSKVRPALLRTELKSGIQYWSLERKLCQALLRNEKVNELHMDFLSVSEFLVEISDDLYDYEDDVMNNTFNILRMFAAIYGPLEAPNMLAKCIGEAEEKYESFSKKLDPSLSGSYWRRCEEATKEGGKTSGHAYGTWNIPRVISNEDAFRRERRSKHDACAVIT
ncbi:hypothetical protein ZEAMMB73_Zm00001d003491 [Zea mays]|uniref:Uncharacterized protein n=1 Tax=Zea mays TaxID=4577 RepID=A0A1D6E9F3_MAIZE|nr:hypothetical protein ZEAMMB73_Zm00001d003491 [Zea mays]